MGKFADFLTWYRLVSDTKHLFIKINGQEFLKIQPTTIQEAEELGAETKVALETCKAICVKDGRTAVMILDVKDVEVMDVEMRPFLKFLSVIQGPDGGDIDRIEVRNSGNVWSKLVRYMPSDLKNKIVIVS